MGEIRIKDTGGKTYHESIIFLVTELSVQGLPSLITLLLLQRFPFGGGSNGQASLMQSLLTHQGTLTVGHSKYDVKFTLQQAKTTNVAKCSLTAQVQDDNQPRLHPGDWSAHGNRRVVLSSNPRFFVLTCFVSSASCVIKTSNLEISHKRYGTFLCRKHYRQVAFPCGGVEFQKQAFWYHDHAIGSSEQT